MRVFLTFILAVFLVGCSTQSKHLSQNHTNKIKRGSVFPLFHATSGVVSKDNKSKRDIASPSGQCPDLSGNYYLEFDGLGADDDLLRKKITIEYQAPYSYAITMPDGDGHQERVALIADGIQRTIEKDDLNGGIRTTRVSYCHEGLLYAVSGFFPDPTDPSESGYVRDQFHQIKFRTLRKTSTGDVSSVGFDMSAANERYPARLTPSREIYKPEQ